jgi:hypothetical protein
MAPSTSWLSLTDLGRLYGISAIYCGRLLCEAGLREQDGRPSVEALSSGVAQVACSSHRHVDTLWHENGCRAALEARGQVPLAQRTLVEQWAELLWAMKQGSAAVSTSAEQMAEELPGELVEPVNQQLRVNGWDFQVPRPHHSGGGAGAGAGVSGTGEGHTNGSARSRNHPEELARRHRKAAS